MKEILFLIPAKLTRPYFSSLYCECEDSVYSRFGDRFRPIWRCVPREAEEFDEKRVIEILRREVRQSEAIGLLVVAPTESEHFTAGVAEVARQLNVSVLALSLPFQHPKLFHERGLSLPASVHCDSGMGAQKLAHAACSELHRRRAALKNPRVVLIPGQPNRSDSIQRLESFKFGLIESGLDPVLHEVEPCNWQRGRARLAMEQLIKESKHPIDLVFAANDEMALGARDAIRHSRSAAHCHVYGFDAITEVRSLIDNNDEYMKGTVEQDIPEMAYSLADLIDRTIERNPDRPPVDVLIKPKCILPPADNPIPSLQDIPEFELLSGQWVPDHEAATIERLGEDTLHDYRKLNQQAKILKEGEIGLDRFGRIWRWDRGHKVYYLKRTLKKSPPHRGI